MEQEPQKEQGQKRVYQERRQYFILPKFQVSFLVQVCSLLIIVLFIFNGIELYFFGQIFDSQETISSEALYILMGKQVKLMFALKMLVMITAFLIWGIIYSHKVAGPVWRVMSLMEQLAKSEKPNSFRLRKNDYFQELADTLEQLAKKRSLF